MKDILSQAEIDTLLSALTAGELEAEQAPLETEARVKPYDFRRPNKFSKEQLRTLGFIHENFCHLVSNFLSGYLRSNIQVKVLSVEQITYEDFALSIPIPTLLTMVNLSPLPGTVVLETNLSFIFPVI
ncbi:MAG: flagellar motor switch protein FliM, partial [Clostridia bacterium]|nr:flagellar motor switch protein FliM [Clostridia bacterium]